MRNLYLLLATVATVLATVLLATLVILSVLVQKANELCPIAFGEGVAAEPPAPVETEEPFEITNGEKVICDPFAEIREDRPATRAKYEGKTVLLHGVVDKFRSCDGGYFIYCVGPRQQIFVVRVNDDKNFDKVKSHQRVVVKGKLNPGWSGCPDYFGDLTVWDGILQEIHEATNFGWAPVWKLGQQ
jgi:hypothetical protein